MLLAVAGRFAADGISAVRVVRVVTAHADRAKAGMLAGLSLSLAEQWWVRELRPVGPPAAPGRSTGPGFSGLLTPAPPVYDPGGFVFLADPAGEDANAIARGAEALGAVLAAIAGHHHLRDLRAAHDRPVPPARRPAGPHLRVPARRLTANRRVGVLAVA